MSLNIFFDRGRLVMNIATLRHFKIRTELFSVKRLFSQSMRRVLHQMSTLLHVLHNKVLPFTDRQKRMLHHAFNRISDV